MAAGQAQHAMTSSRSVETKTARLYEDIHPFIDIEKTMQNYRPLYTFDITPYQNRLRQLLRQPFTSQSHCISGLAKCYQEGQRSAFMVGEMGVGKTLIGASTSFVAGFKKILILCPPHLVKKWEREIKSTVPHSRVVILKTATDVDKAVAIVVPEKINYFIKDIVQWQCQCQISIIKNLKSEI